MGVSRAREREARENELRAGYAAETRSHDVNDVLGLVEAGGA